jgi:hypothetical protein
MCISDGSNERVWNVVKYHEVTTHLIQAAQGGERKSNSCLECDWGICFWAAGHAWQCEAHGKIDPESDGGVD